MNFKLLSAATCLFVFGATIPVLSADERELSNFKLTHECVECNLNETSIKSGNLRDADLQRANLLNANFSDSDLSNANFQNANLRSANFKNSDLSNANFSNANVTGAYFCGANLNGVIWEGVIHSRSTQCLPDEAINYISQDNLVHQ
ncbi:pentapeptide repeat-containing protein [Myxosarcina sp. GI1]|uniref:pentapeptide repeat-containing protein n=1 Tax=Myxosarcina sp. GI1 TaxID=1541065 RepID=UPI000689B3BB|nr:pentapeptide repeat-containing protein [Myxosarcina sp. GI1]